MTLRVQSSRKLHVLSEAVDERVEAADGLERTRAHDEELANEASAIDPRQYGKRVHRFVEDGCREPSTVVLDRRGPDGGQLVSLELADHAHEIVRSQLDVGVRDREELRTMHARRDGTRELLRLVVRPTRSRHDE